VHRYRKEQPTDARNVGRDDAAVDRMCSSIRELGFKIPALSRSGGEAVDCYLRLG
jgi:hypothetical protein